MPSIKLNNLFARGRNGEFNARLLSVARRGTTWILQVHSRRSGKNPPIEFELDDASAKELCQELENDINARRRGDDRR